MTEPLTSTLAAPARSRLRRYLPWLGLVLLAWVLSRFDRHALATAFERVTWIALAQACVLFGANLLIKAFRWQRMLAAQALSLPTSVSVAAFLSSQFYGQVTLGRLGELYRAEALTERGVPVGLALSSSIYDRLLDLAIVLFVAAVLGALVVGDARAALAAALAMLLLMASGIALVHAERLATLGPVAKLRALLHARRGTRGALALVAQLVEGMGPLLRPRFALESLAWTFVAWLGYFGSLWQLAAGMGLSASPVLLTAGAALAALSSLLPITVSGLGAREVIFMHVLALEQVDGASAVVLSLLHLAVMTGTVIALGLLGVVVRQRQHGAGRRVEPQGGS